MGASTYSRCEEMIGNLSKSGVKKLDRLDMVALISKFIGSDPRTVYKALNLMIAHGLITEKRHYYKIIMEDESSE